MIRMMGKSPKRAIAELTAELPRQIIYDTRRIVIAFFPSPPTLVFDPALYPDVPLNLYIQNVSFPPTTIDIGNSLIGPIFTQFTLPPRLETVGFFDYVGNELSRLTVSDWDTELYAIAPGPLGGLMEIMVVGADASKAVTA